MKENYLIDELVRGESYAAPTIEALYVQCEEGFAVSDAFSSEFDNQPGQWN